MNQLRYSVERHPGQSRYEIRDRQSGRNLIAAASQGETAPEEYAIVARVFDRSIEKNVFLIAGVADRSTSAAGEFRTNKACARAVWTKAPSHWPKNNAEFVLITDLAGGVAGPPRVVAPWIRQPCVSASRNSRIDLARLMLPSRNQQKPHT